MMNGEYSITNDEVWEKVDIIKRRLLSKTDFIALIEAESRK